MRTHEARSRMAARDLGRDSGPHAPARRESGDPVPDRASILLRLAELPRAARELALADSGRGRTPAYFA
jgi:hypothetical protein